MEKRGKTINRRSYQGKIKKEKGKRKKEKMDDDIYRDLAEV
jgi:hypothetical protein